MASSDVRIHLARSILTRVGRRHEQMFKEAVRAILNTRKRRLRFCAHLHRPRGLTNVIKNFCDLMQRERLPVTMTTSSAECDSILGVGEPCLVVPHT